MDTFLLYIDRASTIIKILQWNLLNNTAFNIIPLHIISYGDGLLIRACTRDYFRELIIRKLS